MPAELLDTGSLRGDLLVVAKGMLARYFGSDGIVRLRAMIEAKIYPDLFGQALGDLEKEETRLEREVVPPALQTNSGRYAERVVGFVLGAASHRPQADGTIRAPGACPSRECLPWASCCTGGFAGGLRPDHMSSLGNGQAVMTARPSTGGPIHGTRNSSWLTWAV
ncbi:hypothetical protein [Streptomyces fulvoviolaceus]|uniref:hypothetical protein n=1 Tax=Streptomyces fulvoviolaceus TaxID=285535 RepID=UPI0004CBC7A1|nr:hypothetical protein [Streptomyces fulvoviolaceus]